MRRCLSILLLLWMPFQFSWAVAAAYCEHESGVSAGHLGHHEHHHQPTASDAGGGVGSGAGAGAGEGAGAAEASKAKPGLAALDVADCHFHCPCAVAWPASLGMPVIGGADRPTSSAAPDACPPVRARPERPKWPGHA